MSDVFISYSRQDKEFVGKLREELSNRKQDVWIDWEDIPPSQSWWNEIQKGIAKANNFVLVMSPNSLSSPVCHMEIEYARQLKKRIIPVLHADYVRDICLDNITTRLSKSGESTTRDIWGERLPQNVFDANDSELKHINYFFFKPDADFKTRVEELFTIIHTDYEHKEQHTTLLLRAREWDRRARDSSFLLLDNELEQAEAWLASAPGKEPPPTDLHLDYIRASEQRTRQLRNIRRASIVGSIVAVLALISAIGASLIGFRATGNANTAGTLVANANEQLATATRVADQAVQARATLGAVNTQAADQAIHSRATLGAVNTQAADQSIQSQATLGAVNTQIAEQSLQSQATLGAVNTQIAEQSLQSQATLGAVSTQVVVVMMTATDSAIVQDIIENFADAMLQQDDPSLQIAIVDALVARYPDKAQVYHSQGTIFDELERYDEAIASYTEALRLDPGYFASYNNRGVSYIKMENYEAALADYTEALRLSPDYITAYNNRASIYVLWKDYEQAIADYTRVIDIDPLFAIPAYIGRGDSYGNLRRYDEALADYETVLDLDPTNATVYGNRGYMYYLMGKYDEALTDLSEAIRLDPEFSQAYNNRGLVYQETGEYDKAFADHDKAIQLDPKLGVAYGNRGFIYFLQEEYEKAEADYNEAIRLEPELDVAYRLRGELYARFNYYDDALTDFNEAIRLDPEFAQAYASRGDLHANAGEFEEAIEDYNTVISLEPKSPVTFLNHGIVSQILGDFEQAMADFSEAIRLDPNLAEAYNNRAYLYFNQGDSDKALTDITTAIELIPDEPEYYDSRCDLYLMTEQWALGIADCEKAEALGQVLRPELSALLSEARQKIADAEATTEAGS